MKKLILLLFLAEAAFGAFEYREQSPSALFPYSQAASDPQPDSVSNPAYLPLIRYGYLIFSGSKPYSLDPMSSTGIRAGYSGTKFGLQAGWTNFGIDEYREDVFEAKAGCRISGFLFFGAALNYYRLSINTDELHRSCGRADSRTPRCKSTRRRRGGAGTRSITRRLEGEVFTLQY